MKKVMILFLMMVLPGGTVVEGQFLSKLEAGKNDPLYTTYAAPPERSHYKTDQGYQFLWFDKESGVEFVSNDGPNAGIAFLSPNRLVFRLGEFFSEPVVTISYSDLVKYHYYPLPEIKAEVFFAVYSSESAFLEFRITNESHFGKEICVIPYLYYPSADSLSMVTHCTNPDGYTFPLYKKRDSWMKEHNIPLEERLTGFVSSTIRFDSVHAFSQETTGTGQGVKTDGIGRMKQSFAQLKRNVRYVNGLAGFRTFRLQPGDGTVFRIKVEVKAGGQQGCGSPEWDPQEPDPGRLVREDEKAYGRIPALKFSDRDQEMMYWSSFSLLRQCMMPPEGDCHYNYYVFSREPRWGWGYGGQVFHESLAMLAYAYMDPAGAMNSQRVYMERQRSDGYIGYRTGPYLNETIEVQGKPTSSAPWFNYENLEIFKVTGDRRFLEEAYESGKRFYRWFVASRDSNSNGLCEWGGHAELESVRDARVAVWDQAGWASNFEGPDLNSMLVKEAASLSEIATILGFGKEADKFRQEAQSRAELINRYMWDPDDGFYYNVGRNDQTFSFHNQEDLKVKEIIGFLPLWASVPDKDRAAALIGTMKDTSEFWRPFGVPTLTAKSDYYCPIGYWNGPVWVQWEYLLYRGLRDYGYDELANELASRVLNNIIYHLKNDHVFWEFYSPDDRQAGWNRTYIWAGLSARFLIDGVAETTVNKESHSSGIKKQGVKYPRR